MSLITWRERSWCANSKWKVLWSGLLHWWPRCDLFVLRNCLSSCVKLATWHEQTQTTTIRRPITLLQKPTPWLCCYTNIHTQQQSSTQLLGCREELHGHLPTPWLLCTTQTQQQSTSLLPTIKTTSWKKEKIKQNIFQHSLIFFNIKDETRDVHFNPITTPPPTLSSSWKDKRRVWPWQPGSAIVHKTTSSSTTGFEWFLIARQNAKRRGKLKTLSKSWRVPAGEDEI